MKTADKVHELFLNYACNAKCAFCYNPPITPELLRRELSFDQAAASLYAAAKGGASMLNMHGGEVTLRDDLPKILGLSKKLGFKRITIVTNGVRLAQPGYARLLARSGATHFRVSIHAPEARLHDEILAIPGAFDKAVEGLAALKALKIPHGLNFVLHKKNLEVLPAFLERFCVEGDTGDVIVYFPHLRGMAAIYAGEVSLTYAQAAPWVREGAARLAKAGRLDALMLANFVPCVLPELEGRMLDWGREASAESGQTHPEGFTDDLVAMKHEQRRPVPACAQCSLGSRCHGVETEYLERYGGEGFAPLAAKAAAR